MNTFEPQAPLQSRFYHWPTSRPDPTPVGERRPMFEAHTGTLDKLAVHATTLNPGERAHEPHRHPEEEMIIVKEGTLEAILNETTVKLEAGSVFFIAPNDLHGTVNIGSTRATYFVVRWWTPATGT